MRPSRNSPSRMLAAVACATVLLGASPAPVPASASGAAEAVGDTLVFVPHAGHTMTFWHAGVESGFDTVNGSGAEGNFSAEPGSDVFVHTAGVGPDGIVHVTPSPGGIAVSFRPENVGGHYRPLVGDFDANGIDDIFWYTPGVGHLWRFRPDGSHTSRRIDVQGHYRTAVLDMDGDGGDELLWYGPGSKPDYIWWSGPEAVPRSQAITIRGDYQLVPGRFGDQPAGAPQERLLFFAKDGPDSIWTFDTSGAHTSAPGPDIDGTFHPVVGNFVGSTTEEIFFYRPGTGSERLVAFTPSGGVQELGGAPSVTGSYRPYQVETGDYDGNGYTDIAWKYFQSSTAKIWGFEDGDVTSTIATTSNPDTHMATTRSQPT